MNYVAIIGDIVRSRTFANRNDVQCNLTSVLSEINTYYGKEIASSFTITLGDEFQGLLNVDSAEIMEIVCKLQQLMYPVKIRFGIGVGSASTSIIPDKTFMIDGPCYHMARKAITKIKEDEKKSESKPSLMRLEFPNEVPGIDIANSLLMMISITMEKWTPKQVDTIVEYEKNGRNQTTTAAKLGVERTTVGRSLEASNYYAYYEAQNALSRYITEGGKNV